MGKTMKKVKGFTTQIVHHDRRAEFTDGPVHAPVYNSVPYGYATTEALEAVFEDLKLRADKDDDGVRVLAVGNPVYGQMVKVLEDSK